MNDLVRYRAMESLCRQSAVFRPLESWRLLAEAVLRTTGGTIQLIASDAIDKAPHLRGPSFWQAVDVHAGRAARRTQFVMWAVTSDCWNIAFRAVVMSAGVFAVKKKFGDAQP
jgi:hypothetical protein